MKKVCIVIIAIFVLLIGVNNVVAGEKVDSDWLEMFYETLEESNYDTSYTAYRVSALAMLYNDVTVDFLGDYGQVQNGYGGYIGLTPIKAPTEDEEYPTYSQSDYQCVSFVQAISSIGNTSDWIKGTQITKKNLPLPGDIIAYFNGQEIYYSDWYCHVAVVLFADRSEVIVIDQNWDMNGIIAIHKLKFSKKGKDNPSNYHFVEGLIYLD